MAKSACKLLIINYLLLDNPYFFRLCELHVYKWQPVEAKTGAANWADDAAVTAVIHAYCALTLKMQTAPQGGRMLSVRTV
jgi:hypothetical protein